MRSFNNKGVYKALLLASGASIFVLASPAMAQDQDVDPPVQPGVAVDDDDTPSDNRIVVTGSRIQRQDYEANSPIVTVDEDFFQQSSTAAVEQQLNKLPQFVVSQSSTANNSGSGILPAGGDIQPNATNTPGAATVSLRGVGANRTLVLIDGRRGIPTNAGGAVDISTIPSAALQRVEIISGGASATYGADAIAGVTNFILKSDYEGLELDGQFGINQYGAGFEYQVGGIVGSDFADGRGNVSFAMSLNTRERINQGDTPFYRDLWADPDRTSGQFFFVPRPGVGGLGFTLPNNATCPTTTQGCVLTNYFASQGANTPPVPNNTGTVYVNADGSLFTTGFNARGGSANFEPWPVADAITSWGTTSVGTLKYINNLTPLTVPTTRYNFLGRGNYEINDWIGVFGQAMFSHNTTYTAQEPGPIVGGWGVSVPYGDGTYTGNDFTPSSVNADGTTNQVFQAQFPFLNCAGYTTGEGGCTNTEAFQQVIPDTIEGILDGRFNPNGNFSPTGFLPNPRETFSDVKNYQIVAGLEGALPGTDWTWEAFVSHGFSQSLTRQTGMYSLERLRGVMTSPNFGQNFSYTGNPSGGGFGASTGTCQSGLDFFNSYQGITEDCRDAIAADVSNRATNRQTIVEANTQGGLFELPAGQLRFAMGASYREVRYEFVNETLSTAGRSFNDQVVGIYPSANMPDRGLDVHELYGELLIPILADIPFIQEFNLEVGGRMSNYNTTGTSYTFKVLGDWRVTDWLRFRGGFNRAERAPNIAELLLTPQQAFRVDGIGDVCSTRHNNPGSANPDTNPDDYLDVQAICLELMARDNDGVYVSADPNDPSFIEASYYNPEFENQRQPTGGGFAFSYAVGNQYYRENISADAAPLTPEVADTWTLGAVIQGPTATGPLSRLNLTVDYFNIKIKDPIGAVPAGGILLRCVSSQYNPAAAGVASGANSVADLDDPAIRAAAQAAIQQSTCPGAERFATGAAPGGGTETGGANTNGIFGTYSNEGGIRLSGIDAVLSWGTDVGPGALFLSLNGNYMFNFEVQELDGQPFLDYVGTTGTGALGVNSGSSFEYRIFGTVGYNWGPANVSLQWNHIPATEDGGEAFFLNGLAPAGTDNNGLPAYNLFSLNAGYQVNDNVRLRAGIDNLFNTTPPITGVDVDVDPTLGQLPGGGYSLFHDVQGRRFSFGANLQF